ncbi:hypothetical protein F0562_035887 [Nyssa sinensis]|uniref:Uncharacterized protein n=1 Tax=Nyssa sinensis TaxID=561372 RepID=A0A5J5AFE9_9ASTE|nr:hypothetical protein F0562_035887 [Nyssa sinensis]
MFDLSRRQTTPSDPLIARDVDDQDASIYLLLIGYTSHQPSYLNHIGPRLHPLGPHTNYFIAIFNALIHPLPTLKVTPKLEAERRLRGTTLVASEKQRSQELSRERKYKSISKLGSALGTVTYEI